MKDTLFVNRHQELDLLSNKFESDKFEFIIIYGRRRVGKSRLIIEAAKQFNSIYFLATEGDANINLQNFKNDIAEQIGDEHILSLKDDWEVVIRYLANQSIVLIIDEFPYLISNDKALKSIFQRIIDNHLIDSKLKLVLAGSSIKMMKSEVLGYKSPLYGRRTAQILLGPLQFNYLKDFFPSYTFEELVHVYGAIGGVPYYLHQFDNSIPFWENVQQNMLSEFKVLFEEAEFLLREEFSSPSTYMSILEQIAAGRTEINDIKQQLSGSGDISSYMKNLREVELIDRKVPLGENKTKSRRGRYHLKDNYLKFWFKYILPLKSTIQRGNTSKALKSIRNDYNSYLGYIFEEIIQQWIIWMTNSDANKFPLVPETLGRWWYKETEIDLVLSNQEAKVFIEIKWSEISKIDAKRIKTNLVKKSETTMFKGHFNFALICKTYLDEKDEIEGLLIFDQDDIYDTWIE